MNRTIKDIQKDIEQLGIKGGYDVEQLLTPQDCRRLSYEIERLNNIINELEKWLKENQILYGINQQGFSWGVCGEAFDKVIIENQEMSDWKKFIKE